MTSPAAADAFRRLHEGGLLILPNAWDAVSARLIESVPSTRPRELENPRLVVASASNPSDAKSFAVPASQGFGMMKIPGRSCSARKARARSACVRMLSSSAALIIGWG